MWVGGKWIEAEVWAPTGGNAGEGAARCQDPGPCRQPSSAGAGMLIRLSPHQVRDGEEGQGQGRGRHADDGFSPSRPSYPQTPRVSSTPSPSNQRGPPSSGSSRSCWERAPGRASWRYPGSRSPRGWSPGGTNAERWDRPPESRYPTLFPPFRLHLPAPLSF